MAAIPELSALIPLLRSNGVSKFRQDMGGAIEIEFEPSKEPPSPPPPLPKGMPKELGDVDAMSEDQILNWSAPAADPADAVAPLPGTGDAPIEP